ncbi:hypothetical protein [Limosilactobacillus caviae]|uniref:Uncharacterized protein n=1 Tax=Limosilactobacillus caviae TaxID=1769424 RepID=A0ABQ2CAL4_9LACO|nr:hypothetical protein [Limosilactobacillus caviae]GGI63804.1 hypothetical protein GCM10011459_16380 [Limosilactobacillus caviae]
MADGLYRDLSFEYMELIVSDMRDLIDGIDTDKAHKKQFNFRFNLFKKNVDSFESLFNETSTIIDPGQYKNFRFALAQFVLVIQNTQRRDRTTKDDLKYLEEFYRVCHEFLYR